MNYYVYEHWLDDECLYVGKGSNNRAFDFEARRDDYRIFLNKNKNNIKVKIVKYFDNEEEALDFEKNRQIEYYKIGQVRFCRDSYLSPEYNPMYGKKHKIKSIEKMRQWKLNNPTSKETADKISKALTGRTRGAYTYKKGVHPWVGRKHKEESIQSNREKHEKKILLKHNEKELIIDSRLKCIDYCKKEYNISRKIVVDLLKSEEGFKHTLKRHQIADGLTLKYLD